MSIVTRKREVQIDENLEECSRVNKEGPNKKYWTI
jgi:hypothetical protein